MNIISKRFDASKLIKAGCCLLVAFALGAGSRTSAEEKSTSAAPAQISFESPEAALSALIDAAERFDVNALSAILGPGSEDLLVSPDPVSDKKWANQFAARGREKHSIEFSASKNRATVSVGSEEWPFPIPLVKRGAKWYFDSQQGRSEVLRRRIGSNELDAIAICRGFVEAQEEYASTIHDDSGLNEYAQKIISTPGKQDGLYWENPDGMGGGPISEPIARAIQEGYTADKKSAFHGYYFKVLKARGPSAPGGEIDFVIAGHMIGGFALVAAPAEYGVTGIKTFMVSYEGIVYQKDLGPNSLESLSTMSAYNPDKTWSRTDDSWPFDIEASVDAP